MNARRRSMDKWQDEHPHSIAMESMSPTNSPSSAGVIVPTVQPSVPNNALKCRSLSMDNDTKVLAYSKALHNHEPGAEEGEYMFINYRIDFLSQQICTRLLFPMIIVKICKRNCNKLVKVWLKQCLT